MCCILYIPQDVENPPENILDTIYKYNQDGIGYVCINKDTNKKHTNIIHHRSFDYNDLKQTLKYRDTKTACVIHFRAASKGSVTLDNVQPFFDESIGIYFAHNGTFHNIKANTDRSDSNIFFNHIFVPLARNYGWNNPILWEIIQSYAEKSRLIFVNNCGEVKMIAGNPSFKDWICINGIYYSRTYNEIDNNYE